jgi:hypothetical protein
MEARGVLLPYVSVLMQQYESSQADSTAQMLLRVLKSVPLTLTDGFFSVEVIGGPVGVQEHTFIKLLRWNISVSLNNLRLVILEYKLLGHDVMSDFQIHEIRSHPEISSQLTSVFRKQLQRQLPYRTMDDIAELAAVFEGLSY